MEAGPALIAFLKVLLLPPGVLLLVGGIGLLLWRRSPRLARGLLVGTWVVFYLLCTPYVSAVLELAVGTSKPVDPEALRTAQAIVILGGGVRGRAAEYGGETLGGLTLERVRYGARLARATQLPVLVTGGRAPWARRAEADLMRDALEQEFGVPVRWAENGSANTRENARKSAAILLPLGIKRVAVVMHGFDVARATLEFTEAGFDVVPAPTFLARPKISRPADVLPQAGALQISYYSLYELAGLIARPLR